MKIQIIRKWRITSVEKGDGVQTIKERQDNLV